jgi:hypothetical protein
MCNITCYGPPLLKPGLPLLLLFWVDVLYRVGQPSLCSNFFTIV